MGHGENDEIMDHDDLDDDFDIDTFISRWCTFNINKILDLF